MSDDNVFSGHPRTRIMCSSPSALRQCCAGAVQMCMTPQHVAAALKAWSGYTGDAAVAVQSFDAACAKGSLRTAWQMAGSSGVSPGKLLTPKGCPAVGVLDPGAIGSEVTALPALPACREAPRFKFPAACCQLQARQQPGAQQNQPNVILMGYDLMH